MDASIRSALLACAVLSHLSSNSVPLIAQAEQPRTAVELGPGVVVDPQRQVVYLMNPKSGIDAVRLERGDVLWHSDQAARPLALTSNVLVAQVDTQKPGTELVLRTLDGATGRTRQTITHVLPAGTRTGLAATAESSFSVQAAAAGAEATLAWEFVDRPMQGVRPGALDVDRVPGREAVAPATAATPTSSGVVRIDVVNGRVSGAGQAEQAPRPVQRLDAPPEARLSAVSGEQFLSADGRYVLTSERTGDDSVFDKYQWTVFERASGRRVGAVRDYRSHAPFTVVGNAIIYETGPLERRTEGGLVAEPLMVRAVDLTKGAQLWAREVRDLTYRGPFPP